MKRTKPRTAAGENDRNARPGDGAVTLQDVVAYERINYLMLMMVDPDVHFHVIPRYAGSRQFGDIEFRDAGWPGPPALDAAVALEPATSVALLNQLREAWLRSAGQDRAP